MASPSDRNATSQAAPNFQFWGNNMSTFNCEDQRLHSSQLVPRYTADQGNSETNSSLPVINQLANLIVASPEGTGAQTSSSQVVGYSIPMLVFGIVSILVAVGGIAAAWYWGENRRRHEAQQENPNPVAPV